MGDTHDGYTLTKWVSECLLEVAALEHNLLVWIHWPTTILGDGALEQDLMPAIIKYS